MQDSSAPGATYNSLNKTDSFSRCLEPFYILPIGFRPAVWPMSTLDVNDLKETASIIRHAHALHMGQILNPDSILQCSFYALSSHEFWCANDRMHHMDS